jgi:hypothetical protein
MNKEFIPYEQALELKKLGFDIPSISSEHGHIWEREILYQQAFRWFRDKKLCDGSVCRHGDADGGYSYCWEILCEYGVYEHRHFKLGYETYEEAELACLDKLIEIVKGGEL